ncbi:L,D-transpeptidase family protein [Parafilimonas sp.]|uniref:L,D-transpeptidase family protein n=1 Tax=Parafilimonas sp. TaxID=1969739 RepID=UPI0039E4C157
MKSFLSAAMIFISLYAAAQPSFMNYQASFPRVSEALNRKADTLKKQLAAAGLQWPVKQMYIRSFKYDSQLEVWVRNSQGEPFKLFKTYSVCALAGTLGPKRMQGDYQVPEGFYYINEFKPNSNYHMSLGLNYPNASDKIVCTTNRLNPGGDIYIHGSCITVGCIPIQDPQIEELYILAMSAKSNGQDFIPVHIYPIRFSNPKSIAYLEKVTKEQPGLQAFADKLKEVYDYFEKEKRLPVISIDDKGSYVVLD